MPSASFVTASSPKTKALVPLTRPGQRKVALLHQAAQAAQGHSAVAADLEPAAGQKASSATQPLINFIKKSRAGSRHRKSRDLPRGMDFQ